jgi:hypothetical protein
MSVHVCSQCGSPVLAGVSEEEFGARLCRLCVRSSARSRVATSRLVFIEEMEVSRVVEGPLFEEGEARAAHREIDRAVAALASVDLVAMRRRMHEMVRVDRSSVPDGFPSSTAGAVVSPGVGGGFEPCVELVDGVSQMRHDLGEVCDHCARVNLTSVEGAVAARVRHQDEYHRKVEMAVGYLADASSALRAAMNKMLDVDRLRASAGLQPGEPGCWALDRVGGWEPVLHRVKVDGVERALGQWAYKFYRRNGRLPNRRECLDRLAGTQRVRPEA